MMTVEELERLKAAVDNGEFGCDCDDQDGLWYIECDTVSEPLSQLIALAIHGLNCQAAGITPERLGDITMVPVVDMDEVKA